MVGRCSRAYGGVGRFLFMVAVLAGCSGKPPAAPASVGFSGTVHRADGKPVGNVLVHFHPLAPGFSCATQVAGDGSFTTAAPPGRYAWSLRRAEQAPAAEADAAIAAVLEPFRETDLSRTVTVAEGAQVAIAVP